MDWNQDGIVDILSGCYWSEGADAGHIQLLTGKGRADFAAAETVLNAAGLPLTNVDPAESGEEMELRNICTHQHAVDYDADGDLDLIVGCFGSDFFFVENHGGDGPPTLTDPRPLSITLPGGHSSPHLVDWDGDGDLDLLSGSAQGGVFISENVGGRQIPKWADFVPLLAPLADYSASVPEEQVVGPGAATRVWATDWNGDGQLDLLIGDSVTVSSRAPHLSPPEFQRRKAQYQQQLAEFEPQYRAVLERYAAAESAGAIDSELQQELQAASMTFSELNASRSEFMTERGTGFVWLLLRKSKDSSGTRGTRQEFRVDTQYQ